MKTKQIEQMAKIKEIIQDKYNSKISENGSSDLWFCNHVPTIYLVMRNAPTNMSNEQIADYYLNSSLAEYNFSN